MDNKYTKKLPQYIRSYVYKNYAGKEVGFFNFIYGMTQYVLEATEIIENNITKWIYSYIEDMPNVMLQKTANALNVKIDIKHKDINSEAYYNYLRAAITGVILSRQTKGSRKDIIELFTKLWPGTILEINDRAIVQGDNTLMQMEVTLKEFSYDVDVDVFRRYITPRITGVGGGFTFETNYSLWWGGGTNGDEPVKDRINQWDKGHWPIYL